MSAEKQQRDRICICMGSSCFARGNNRNIEIIQHFVREQGTAMTIQVEGCLCMDQCSRGPNVRIGETLYHEVDPNSCLDLLRKHFDVK